MAKRAKASRTAKLGGTVKISLSAAQRQALKRIGADVKSLKLTFPKRRLRGARVTCILDRVPVLRGNKRSR